MTRMARWRRELREPLPEGETVNPLRTIEEIRRAVLAVPGITATPATDLILLHEAVLDETVRKAGPRTFLRHLGEVVAAHLNTRDPEVVKAALERLQERGLIRPMGEGDSWNPRARWWIEAF